MSESRSQSRMIQVNVVQHSKTNKARTVTAVGNQLRVEKAGKLYNTRVKRGCRGEVMVAAAEAVST